MIFASSSDPVIDSDASYQFDVTYNALGTPESLTYPVSTAGVRVKVKYGYTGGVLSSIQDYTGNVNGPVLWNLNLLDARANAVSETYGNGLWLQNAFDPLTGEARARQAGTGGQASNVQNLAYLWDKAGNLQNRQDLRQGLTESFTYDALDRLTNASGPGAQSLSVGYDALGNVTSRSDVGSYGYHAVRKHAVVSAGSNSYTYDANGNMATRNGSTLTWTSDNLPASLSASGYTASFNYAPDRSRWRQVSTYAGATETTIYVGGLLEKLTTSVRVHWKHRIPTPSGEVQVIRRSDGTTDTFYVTTDHLGSTEAVMDGSGAILARESFGAWGARRGSNWSSSTPPDWTGIANTTRRGYTGHEALDNILLVHMNGRVYDPAIGRFLSADPYVNGIDASQGWNRYAYVNNGPLRYVDPSGYFQRGDSLRAWVRAIEPGRSWEFSWGTFEGRATERWTLTLNYNSLNFWLGVRDLLRGSAGSAGGAAGRSAEGRSGGAATNDRRRPKCERDPVRADAARKDPENPMNLAPGTYPSTTRSFSAGYYVAPQGEDRYLADFSTGTVHQLSSDGVQVGYRFGGSVQSSGGAGNRNFTTVSDSGIQGWGWSLGGALIFGAGGAVTYDGDTKTYSTGVGLDVGFSVGLSNTQYGRAWPVEGLSDSLSGLADFYWDTYQGNCGG